MRSASQAARLGSQRLAKSLMTHRIQCLPTRTIALSHHEKWDGTGYPQQLKGEEIPRPARIVAIADIFDALTSKRPYKEAWSVKDAVNALESASGKFLDPQLVTAFISVLPQILEVKEQYRE